MNALHRRAVLLASGWLTLLDARAIAQTPAAACEQATGPAARTVRFGPTVAITGAGRIDLANGRLQYIWTGRDCTAWVIVGGNVQPLADERDVVSTAGAEFVAFDSRDSESREYQVTPSGTRFLLNGREAPPSAADREWVAAMVREYVRRAGIGAGRRAQGIIARGGVPALLDEARRIQVQRVRTAYLQMAFGHLNREGVAAYLRDAAGLLDDGYRADLLMAIPRAWRNEAAVLEAVYTAAEGIEPDDDVIALLESFPPPSPSDARIRDLLSRMIASLSTDDARREWRGRYLGSPTGRTPTSRL